jgi:hypothetical protein
MKFSIGTLHPGIIDGHFFHSIVHLLVKNTPAPDGTPSPNQLPIDDVFVVRTGPVLQMGRGILTSTFLESDADALLMLDSDMSFTPEQIHQMWDLFQRLPDDGKILGGLAFISSAPKVGPGTVIPNIWAHAPDRTERFVQVREYPENTLVKVGATGAAALMVHREVFEKIAADMGTSGRWFYHHVMEDGDQMAEDISFCLRARRSGYAVYVHTGLIFGHTKPIVLDETDYRASRQPGAIGGLDVRSDHSRPDSDPADGDFPGPRAGALVLT